MQETTDLHELLTPETRFVGAYLLFIGGLLIVVGLLLGAFLHAMGNWTPTPEGASDVGESDRFVHMSWWFSATPIGLGILAGAFGLYRIICRA